MRGEISKFRRVSPSMHPDGIFEMDGRGGCKKRIVIIKFCPGFIWGRNFIKFIPSFFCRYDFFFLFWLIKTIVLKFYNICLGEWIFVWRWSSLFVEVFMEQWRNFIIVLLLFFFLYLFSIWIFRWWKQSKFYNIYFRRRVISLDLSNNVRS